MTLKYTCIGLYNNFLMYIFLHLFKYLQQRFIQISIKLFTSLNRKNKIISTFNNP